MNILLVRAARAFGLDRQVLARMLAGTAIEEHAKQLGLAISDKTLVEGIRSDPNFQTDGKFNRQGFEGLLQQMGLSEQGFLQLRRQDELKGAIVGAFLKSQTVPKPLFEIMHAYNDEKPVTE